MKKILLYIGQEWPAIILKFIDGTPFYWNLAYGNKKRPFSPLFSRAKRPADISPISCHCILDAWNHCRLSRKDLRDFSIIQNIDKQVFVPEDGEFLNF